MLDSIDPGLVIYMSSAAGAVVVAYFIFSFFVESVRIVHQKALSEEKRKKTEARERSSKAS